MANLLTLVWIINWSPPSWGDSPILSISAWGPNQKSVLEALAATFSSARAPLHAATSVFYVCQARFSNGLFLLKRSLRSTEEISVRSTLSWSTKPFSSLPLSHSAVTQATWPHTTKFMGHENYTHFVKRMLIHGAGTWSTTDKSFPEIESRFIISHGTWPPGRWPSIPGCNLLPRAFCMNFARTTSLVL